MPIGPQAFFQEITAGGAVPGEVTSFIDNYGNVSGRRTEVTPTAGRRIRIVSIQNWCSALASNANYTQIYFGTGAAYNTNTDKAIGTLRNDTASPNPQTFLGWPQGRGPIGAVDEVLSLLKSFTAAGEDSYFIVHYQQE